MPLSHPPGKPPIAPDGRSRLIGPPVYRPAVAQPKAPAGPPVYRPAVAQPKAPAGPPVYRPVVVQPKAPAGPPVYRPAVVQRKAPVGPPVYRPAVVQPKTPAPAVAAAARVPAVRAATVPARPAPVQRYTTYWAIRNWGGLGRAMRVSDDGKMAVPDSAIFQGTKILYATEDVIDAANQRLQVTGSPYRLDQLNETIQGRRPWTLRSYQTLYRVSPRDTRNAVGGVGVKGGSGDNLRTLENCSAHGLDSMGIGIDGPSQALSTRDFRIDVGNGQTVRNSGSSAHEFDSDLVAKRRIMEFIHRDKHGLGADVPVDLETVRDTYAGLTRAERLQYALQLGMNEYAMPQVGEGIEALRAFGNFAGFPMHFAAVVARSGNDYVTLENWAKTGEQRAPGDTVHASGAWYFRMYGVIKTGYFWDDDQSYSGEHAAEGSIADREHMMGLVNQNRPKA